ncbi:dTDP-4-dehydrorhamnose reductase [Devosia sp.]|uniref:dTDP-4-dehydrorhamnose reductase n=1 Tax=Devosia sp. TaxID=1871048 RepID=UPI002FC66C39
MRLVVTGKSGQVATALAERGRAAGIAVIAVGRPEFDLSQAEDAETVLSQAKPDVVVSAAAYTAVDRAETDADAAWAINATAPGHLAAAAARLGVPIVHLSTDYVFEGSKPTPYVETDTTGPLGVYGASKLGGEQAVARATDDYAILRTAWVYSPFGNNFLKTMLRLGADRPELRVVDDQVGNPTSALDIADAVIGVARNLMARPDEASLRGIFHMTGSGEGSWADFACEIFARSAELGGPSPRVTRIATADYPTPARRPANSRMSSALLAKVHGIVMPDWKRSTADTVKRLVAGS